MSFEINESTSILLQRSLSTAQKNLETSIAKIAYGEQKNAIEDAANLIISEEMEAKKRGSQQAIENAQTASNLLSTAESGLSSINDNLQRVRELELQKSNGTYGEEDKAAIDAEISTLTEEIDRVASSTSFNGKQLLDGSASDTTFQIGADGQASTNTLQAGNGLNGGVTSGDLGLDPSAPDFQQKIDSAISSINEKRSDIGATQNRLNSAIDNLQVQNENITAAQSRITDTDVAAEVSRLTQNQILRDSSGSLLAQANQSAAAASILL